MFSSSMASAASHGSDSHDAPLLFVLLCESSVRLCLPRSFLSARCLRGKVLLFSFSPARDLSRAAIHSARWTAPFYGLSVRRALLFTFPAHAAKNEHSPVVPHTYLNFSLARLCFKPFISFSLCSFCLLLHLVSVLLLPTLPSVCKPSLDFPFAFLYLLHQMVKLCFFFFFSFFLTFSCSLFCRLCFPDRLWFSMLIVLHPSVPPRSSGPSAVSPCFHLLCRLIMT